MPNPVAAVVGTVGGSVLSGRAQRKAQSRQNQANEEAYARQFADNMFADRENRSNPYTTGLRSFYESVISPTEVSNYLGGLDQESRDISSRIQALNVEASRIDPEDRDSRGEVDPRYFAIQDEIRDLLLQKEQIERKRIEAEFAAARPAQDRSRAVAESIFSGGLLQDRLDSMAEDQGLLRQSQGIREGFTQEAADAAGRMYDPSQYDRIQAARAQLAADQDSPLARDLALQAVRDRAIRDQIQQNRLDMAEANVAGIEDEALRASQEAGRGRTYGGSSQALLATRAALRQGANAAAQRARLAGIGANLAEDQLMKDAEYRTMIMNERDRLNALALRNQADLDNQVMSQQAEREKNQNILNQIANRRADDMQTLAENRSIAQDKDRARLANQQLQLQNINLPNQILGQRVQDLMGVENAMTNLAAARQGALQGSRMGGGQFVAPQVPVPQIAVNDTFGQVLSGVSSGLGSMYAQDAQFAQQQAMQDAFMKNQRKMQKRQLASSPAGFSRFQSNPGYQLPATGGMYAPGNIG